MTRVAGVRVRAALLCRGTSLIRNTPLLGPYSRTIYLGSCGGPRGAASYGRGTPVGVTGGGGGGGHECSCWVHAEQSERRVCLEMRLVQISQGLE